MRDELHHTRKPRNETAPASVETIRREPIMLDPSMSVVEAFAAVIGRCVTYITAAAEFARRSDNPEGIHEVRVGIRRLRAAFSVFGPVLPARRPPVVAQLRSLQQELGAARELDVLLGETIASMPGKRRKSRRMRSLVEVIEAERAARHRRARTALACRRSAELLSRLGPALDRYVEQRADNNSVHVQSVTVFAADVLHARRRKARKLGKKIGTLAPQELHKLRIRIKKLRYATEFFRDLAPSCRSQRYVRSLKNLQQLLGTTHDAVVACSLIAHVKAERGGRAERAASLVQEWANKSFKRTARKLPRAWRRFEKRKQPLKHAKKLRRQ